MDTMQIEILEPNGADGCAIKDGRDRFFHGDVVTVDRARGERFCAAGLAKDVAGVFATGERSTTPRTLEVQGTRSRTRGGRV